MTSNTFVNTCGDLNTMSLIDENTCLNGDKISLINKVN